MSHPIQRFEGTANEARLLESIMRQQIVDGDRELAAAIIDAGELVSADAREPIIKQDDWDDDIYLILAGSFDIVINGQHKGVREPGTHVGERAQLQGNQKRTASVIAREPSVVLKLSYDAMSRVKEAFPKVWEAIAKVLDERLAMRDAQIGKVNDRPMVFVISSSERHDVAQTVESKLSSDDIDVTLWDNGVFGLSDYAMSSLEDAIGIHDFTIAVVGADDQLVSRGKSHAVARDNVHLEYGISVGKLGRVRSIILADADGEVKLASDQAGLTILRYQGSDMERTVGKACVKARDHIMKHGPIDDR